MDREQEEMQFLGFFGILKESFKIIYSWRTIFSKIALTLILPLSFIFLLHIDISDILFSDIVSDEIDLDQSVGTPRYDKLSDILTKEWTTYLLFKIVYFTFLLILSLLSTAAVVYTIASIYTSRDVTFRNVLSVVPRVWKRLMATFFCSFVAIFLYNTFAIIMILSFLMIFGNYNITYLGLALLGFLFSCIYLIGFVYLSIIWQLASVVSVLEDFYGVSAMMRSRNLIRGKTGLAVAVFFVLNFLLGFILWGFQRTVVFGSSDGVARKACYAILFFVLLSGLFVFGLTVQTVIYFVCKSYHHENIDKSALSDHLEVYLGEYVPLKAKDIQLEHFEI